MGSVVVLGLDGFHTELLEYTPGIAELYARCPSSKLQSTVPPVTAPAWAGFQTGKNQGRHGVFDFVDYDESFTPQLLDGSALQSTTVYELLDEDGYSCFLQNLPFSLPPRIDGDVLPSWLDGDDADPQPPDLCSRLDIDMPSYPSFDKEGAAGIDELRDSFEHNREIFLDVVARSEHDFFFHLVSVTDWLQHMAYREMRDDPDTEVSRRARDLLRSVDAYVAAVEDTLGDGDDFVVLSDHGFDVFADKFFVNDWLLENEYLKLSRDGVRLGDKSAAIQNDGSLNVGRIGVWARRQPGLFRLLRPVKDLFTAVTGSDLSADPQVDMDRTLAYCQSKDESAIRFAEGTDEETRCEIRERLDQYEDISARWADDLYEGPHTDEGGDIVVTSETYKIARGPRGEIHTGNRTAYHDPHGVLIGVGSSFASAPDDPQLLDVTPTLLHLLGEPVPDDVDGRTLTEWLTTEAEVMIRDSETYSPSTDSTEGDSNGVEDRLEELGYL